MIVGDGQVVLVGESPAPPDGVPEGALTGKCGRRLASLCGLSDQDYQDIYARTNLFDHPGAYSREGAILVTRHLTEALVGRHVVLLGARVVAAFGQRPHLFQWRSYFYGPRDARITVAHAPHPSGRSRFWNDPDSVEEARRFWELTTEMARRLEARK